ncbi:MAG: hypothetical protein Kow0069_27360 [Promethearchaeota archaeon]
MDDEKPLFTEAGWVVRDGDLPEKRERRAAPKAARASAEKYLSKPVGGKAAATPGSGGKGAPTPKAGKNARKKGRRPLRIMVIGAHPDDCDLLAGGLALRHARLGNAVKFVAVTNGNAGHHLRSPAETAFVREHEAANAAATLGAEYECLGVDDGHVWVCEDQMRRVVRVVREWCPDLVITHRPYDYHRDHRYTGQLVTDASYMLIVPHYYPEFPVRTRDVPLFAYAWDNFTRPYPFTPDVFVHVEPEEFEVKVRAVANHESQVYEWLPWTLQMEDVVDEETDEDKRLELVGMIINNHFGDVTKLYHESLLRDAFGEGAASFEAFELCQYGKVTAKPPTRRELKRFFPGGFFPKKGVVRKVLERTAT